MTVDDFDYELPAERIAQRPAPARDQSRLLVLERATRQIEHSRFDRLPELLAPGDLLVLNNTRVLPARLCGRKASGGRIELLLVEPEPADGSDAAIWRCLFKASRAPGPGSVIELGAGLAGRVLDGDGAEIRVRFVAAGGDVQPLLTKRGTLPLPPYIRRPDGTPTADDHERYQTVYAEVPGAVAAPTAGLHFTTDLLQALRARGVEIASLTLHVGPGTFLPVRVQQLAEHRLPAEAFELPGPTAAAIEAAQRRRGRVVAVGTTVVRALETAAAATGRVVAGSGRSSLFIYPGYHFRVVEALITNFHLPRSTLLMLVSAFAGRESVLDAYRAAIARDYRFYSYGDAMAIL